MTNKTKDRMQVFLIWAMIILGPVSLVSLHACQLQPPEPHFKPDKMFYVKDFNTGLCFVVYDPPANQVGIANVPCTPEVERLIK